MKPLPITVDWMMEEIMTQWPQTTPVFLKHHLGCIGCCMAAFERLGDALAIYGLPPQIVLDELNRVALEPTSANKAR